MKTRSQLDYLELLRTGICNSQIMGDNGDNREDWDGWFAELEARGSEDGLRLGRYWDIVGAGSFAFPGLWLLRPDGTEYPFREARTKEAADDIVTAITNDWERELRSARLRWWNDFDN